MTQTCPACGQRASGRFCANCGAAIGKIRCPKCENEIPQGGRFCNMCGTPAVPGAAATQPAGGAAGKVPWVVAGVALAALLAVVLVPRFGGDEPQAVAPAAAPPMGGAGAPGAPGDPSSIDLSSMTPRQAADRLFNRVMENVSRGDSVQARTFLPMAIAAYDRVPELDLDGHYHIAVLHLVARDGPAARERSDMILEQVPNHLFGLFTAAQAEILQGDREEARALFQRLLDNYDAEVAQGRPEYTEHQPALAAMRQEAVEAVGGR